MEENEKARNLVGDSEGKAIGFGVVIQRLGETSRDAKKYRSFSYSFEPIVKLGKEASQKIRIATSNYRQVANQADPQFFQLFRIFRNA